MISAAKSCPDTPELKSTGAPAAAPAARTAVPMASAAG
jgi:hypothetical protein